MTTFEIISAIFMAMMFVIALISLIFHIVVTILDKRK